MRFVVVAIVCGMVGIFVGVIIFAKALYLIMLRWEIKLDADPCKGIIVSTKKRRKKMNDNPVRECQVYEELSIVDSRINHLMATVEGLIERVDPVLRPEEPAKPQESKSDDVPKRAPLASQISGASERILAISERIEGVLHRLEI